MGRRGTGHGGAARQSGGETRRCRLGGQTTFEYAGVLVAVAAALLGMAIYLKRGVSGKLREGADAVGVQYAPRVTTSDHTLTVKGTTTTTSTLLLDQEVPVSKTEKVTANVMEYKTDFDDTTERTGFEDVGPMGGSVWE